MPLLWDVYASIKTNEEYFWKHHTSFEGSSEHQVQVLLILVINFPRTTFKYHSIAVFWCLAPYQAKWLCQESLRDTIRSPFSLLTPLFISCVWRLFLTKSIMKCSMTKAWSISIYHFKAFIFTSPISRLGCKVVRKHLKTEWMVAKFVSWKKCKFVRSTERLLNIVSKPLANVWKKVYHLWEKGFSFE